MKRVISHEIEDGMPYFETEWINGDVSIEPLDSFVDTDGVVNGKVLAYAAELDPVLDLQLFVDLLVSILRGERDSYHSD